MKRRAPHVPVLREACGATPLLLLLLLLLLLTLLLLRVLLRCHCMHASMHLQCTPSAFES